MGTEREELVTCIQYLRSGERQPNGEYLHLITCSGDRRFPMGTRGKCCSCKPGRVTEIIGLLEGRLEQIEHPDVLEGGD